MTSLQKQSGYFARNRWLMPLIVVLMLFLARFSIKIMAEFIPDTGFKIPDIIFYAAAVIATIYAGILNVMAGTITAKIFRWLVVAVLIASFVFFIYEKIAG